MIVAKITAADVRMFLRERYSDSRRYAYAEEVYNATGLEGKRRMDMVVVDCFKSNGYAIEAIEVKVSKADLRRELEDSSKHNIFYDHIDYYSLAAPASIVDVELIPKKWGLYLVCQSEDGTPFMTTYRKPLSLHDEFIKTTDKAFIASLFRAMWKTKPSSIQLEAAEKEGYQRGMKELGVEQLKMRINSLEKELEAFRELKERLHIWGTWQIEEGIKQFEAFRNLNLDSLKRLLERIVNNTKDVKKAIKLIENGGGSDD